MKLLFLLPLLSIGTLQVNNHSAGNEKKSHNLYSIKSKNEGFNIGTQTQDGSTKMSAAVFKAQDFCRAELKDFEFDIHYSIVSAVVYFSGTNFSTIVKANITSSSLKPIKSQMERCVPGSIVIFDEVKVMGPDNKIRIIQGVSLVLN